MAGSELDGATEPGLPNAYPSTPGEFAARWNALSEEDRTTLLRGMLNDAAIAARVKMLRQFGSIEELVADSQREGAPDVDPGRC